MKEVNDEVRAVEPRLATHAPTFDWQKVAGERLVRLVELEHDFAVLHDRLDQARSQHDALFLLNDERAHRLQVMQRTVERREALLAEFEHRCLLIESSRSWRITAPLRALSTRTNGPRSFSVRLLRSLIRRARIGRVAARLAPVLSARVRASLYSPSEMP